MQYVIRCIEKRTLSSVSRIRYLLRAEKAYVRTRQSAELRQMVADHKSSDTPYL